MNNTKLEAWLIRVLPLDCPWWHVWNPGSGVAGGLINGGFMYVLLAIGKPWCAVALVAAAFVVVAAKTWLIAKGKYCHTP